MFQKLGSNSTTITQVIESEDKAVFKAIQDGIDRYNTHHIISNAQKVKYLHMFTCLFCLFGCLCVHCNLFCTGTKMDVIGY